MKKFYVLIVVCFGLFIQGYGQDFTWIGGASGNWSDPDNWSGGVVPSTSSHNVIFNSSAAVQLDLDDVIVNSLSVTGTANLVKIFPTGATRVLTLVSSSVSAPAMRIDATNTLSFTTEGAIDLLVYFADNAKGTINGTISVGGFDEVNKAVLIVGENSGSSTEVNVNSGGRMIVETNGMSPITVEEYLNFNAGSKLELKNNSPLIPTADFAVSSEIIISGILNTGLAALPQGMTIGNVTYNCPNQQTVSYLNFLSGLIIQGNLKIENTNNKTLFLTSNQAPDVGETIREWIIKGDLDIQGNSDVVLVNALDDALSYKVTIEGDLFIGGQAFGMQNNNGDTVQPTMLIIKGNIQHTNGSFSPRSFAVNNTLDLFTIEMSGNGTQTISSSAGSFDNTGNQVTLKINKPTSTGLVNLLSPLAVGRVNLTSGILRATSTNYLTVRNTSGEPNVFVSTANSFVEGPLRRIIASTAEQQFATGIGTVKRPISITPATADQTTFEVTLKTSTPSTSFLSPLEGIESNYHWEVNRISGTANAAIKLTLSGGVAGADAGDAIVVARYDGANWVRARGISGGFISPGDLLTGTAQTDEQTSFGLYTFGYGAQAAVLPIKLESFNAKKVNSSAQINWRISENSNPVSFEVMKSGDGINFSKLGTVTASNGKLNYEFTDNTLLTGNNYYRLRMLDKDGIVSFSSIVVVMNGTKGVMISSMIPTMVIDRARLNITSSVNGNMQLVITDISGRVIQVQNASIISGNQEVWLNASRLSSGIFQVTGYMNGEKTATIRFFKR